MSTFRAVKSDPPYYQEVELYYKTNPCPSLKPTRYRDLQNSCKQKDCFYYHTEQERRRPVFHETTHELVYEPVLCESLFTLGKCMDEEKCRYCHTENEMVYHPLYYKTQLCKGCQFDNMIKFCPLYHADEVNRSLVLERFTKENSNVQHSGEETMSRNFVLETFKTKPCTSKGSHNPKVCVFHHSEQDRRRTSNIYCYSPVLCSFVAKKKMCPHGDDCKFSHSMVEQLYHPDRYKKKFCQNHPHNVKKCKYGNYCSFAHSETEIKINLLHNLKKDKNFYLYKYKTVFCPYMFEHDRNQCVYAHNPQDFRREPSENNYSSIQCPDWSQGQIFSYDEGNCPRGMNCTFCHGWKELEYHPLNYKTKTCTNSKNCTKVGCPFLHEHEQHRGGSQEKLKGKDLVGARMTENKKEGSIKVADYNSKIRLYDQFEAHPYEVSNFHYLETLGPHNKFAENFISKQNQEHSFSNKTVQNCFSLI